MNVILRLASTSTISIPAFGFGKWSLDRCVMFLKRNSRMS